MQGTVTIQKKGGAIGQAKLDEGAYSHPCSYYSALSMTTNSQHGMSASLRCIGSWLMYLRERNSTAQYPPVGTTLKWVSSVPLSQVTGVFGNGYECDEPIITGALLKF